MKKAILMIAFLMLWASPGVAQQAAEESKEGTESQLYVFEGRFGLGYRSLSHDGNTKAGEYEYLKSSPVGALDLEYDPLPQRFVLESYYLNKKDYFGETDYAFKDIVLFNAYTRGLFHNLNHYGFGPDDPTTPSPSFTDLNPNDLYGIDNQLSRAFIRFKTPDFPFHLYAEMRTIDREGTIQQRFLRGFTGGLDKVSESRNIDWNTQEVRVGANSHLGPVEADYSHTEKKFDASGDKELHDNSAPPTVVSIPHNLVPDLESSSDTVKLHTSYSGRLVLSGTYTSGDKKNQDSGASVKYWNSAGDLTYMPVTSVIMAVKYRHYDLEATNPAMVNNITPTGVTSVSVPASLSTARDVVSGTLRYRATDRLTLRGEYATESIDRTNAALWDVPENTTKGTAKLGLLYRVMNKLTFRADYRQTKVDNPAYDTDPDKSHAAQTSVTWMPAPRFNTLLSYSTVRESRDQLGAPLGGGSRDATRDQGLASFTMLVGNRSSVTATYAYFKNKVRQTLTFQDLTGAFNLEPGVPYADIAHVGSLSLTVAPAYWMNFTASASKSYSRGTWDLAGTVPNTGSDITQISQLKVIDTEYTAGLEMQHIGNVTSEIRYQYRRYDDQLDATQDGTVKAVLATLSLKW